MTKGFGQRCATRKFDPNSSTIWNTLLYVKIIKIFKVGKKPMLRAVFLELFYKVALNH